MDKENRNNTENAQKSEAVLLRMENIQKSFPGVKALDRVNLTVKAGTVHALMGENGAGKSTLMKCLFGVYQKDDGHIFLEGKEVSFKNSREALENGVAMVHQELNQALKRTVMDNMWLGRFPSVARGIPLTSERKMYRATQEIFERLGIRVDPKTVMSRMPVSQRQMVEIAKAVSYNAKVIVFDEPTSSLTEDEVEANADINADIDAYRLSYRAEVITGKKVLDDTWEEYLNTLNNMGLQTAVDNMNAAYARYKAD